MAIALLGCLAGGASATATTGGAATPAGSPPPPGSTEGAPSPAPSAGSLTLLAAETTPRKTFYFGYRTPRLSFTIDSSQPDNDLRIDVVDAAGAAVRTFYREDVAPRVANTIRWDGTTDAGRPARNGRYSFKIASQAEPAPPARRARRSTAISLSFLFFGYAFPVLGSHDFGSSGARFGAGRSGHTHQGHDVMAACGLPVLAARGGRVQYSGYQSAAGNYVVIDGTGTGFDFMYAHLLEPSPLKTGDVVRTGQPIGVVGSTGSSTACHLHFEIWAAPGWYEGGSPLDPLPYLLKWDRYS